VAAGVDVFCSDAEGAYVEEPAVPIYAAAARGVGGVGARSNKDSSSRRRRGGEAEGEEEAEEEEEIDEEVDNEVEEEIEIDDINKTDRAAPN
jgi:hypothetical protein